MTATISGAIAAAALYVSWAIWVAITLENQHIRSVDWADLAQRPHALWTVMCLINEYGTWGLHGSSNVTGWALWGFWLAEAATVIGVAVFSGYAVLSHHAFCETCGRWCTRGTKILLRVPQDVEQLKLQLEANDLHALETLGPGNKADDHLSVSLDSCTQCGQFHTMSLTRTTIRRDKLGRQKIKHRPFVQHLIIGPGHADVLRNLSDKMSPTPKVNATAAGKN